MSRDAEDRALRPAAVRVPGSTSNLGAGFDCVGLAVDRFLDVAFEPGGAPGHLAVARDDGASTPGGDDLVEAAFRRGLEGRGLRPSGTLRVASAIPVARGLGSSAAALVAGAALADLAAGAALDRDGAFARAAAAEGHGDNAAPSAYGGLRAVVPVDGGLRALPLALSPSVGWAFAAPPVRVATRDARAALPASVPHAVAAGAVARTAALLRGLATADAELLRVGFDDALHAPHRLRLVPGGDEARAAAVEAGAWAATVSGSGSGLLAVGPPARIPAVAEAMARALARVHGEAGVRAFPLRPEVEGVREVPPAGDG